MILTRLNNADGKEGQRANQMNYSFQARKLWNPCITLKTKREKLWHETIEMTQTFFENS